MAKIKWLKVEDTLLIDLDRVERIVLVKSHVPATDEHWRMASPAKIVFNIGDRQYAVSYESDEKAKEAFTVIWDVI